MIEEVSQEIIEYLSYNDELRKTRYKDSDKPLEGHCYVATEALYQFLGGRESEYTPCQMTHEGTSHWFLRTPDGDVIDLTRSQFETEPNYDEGKGKGMQNTPSKRCKEVLQHLDELGYSVEY